MILLAAQLERTGHTAAGCTANVKHRLAAIGKLCQIDSTQLIVMVEEREGHKGIRCASTPAEPSTRAMKQDGYEKLVPQLLTTAFAVYANVLANLPAPESSNLAGTGA